MKKTAILLKPMIEGSPVFELASDKVNGLYKCVEQNRPSVFVVFHFTKQEIRVCESHNVTDNGIFNLFHCILLAKRNLAA